MTDSLRAYPEYKESGQPWLGQIPAHWDVSRCKYLFREIDQRSITGEETHLSMSQRHGLIPSKELEGHRLHSESYVGGKLCQENDLVLNRLKAHLGVFAHARQAGLVSPDYTVLRPLHGEDVVYYELVFKTPPCVAELRRSTKGIVEGFWRLYTDDFYNIRVPVPPPHERKQILRFVSTINATTRRFIRNRWRLIEVLNEQKQAIINQAVTRGLDPNTPLKPSGIDWLGDIPEHWEMRRLRNIAELRVSNVDKHTNAGEVPVRLCNYTDVYKNAAITADMPFMTATATPAETEAFRLHRGDVIITKDSEDWQDIGVPAVVEQAADDLVCGYHLAILRPAPTVSTRHFLAYALQCRGVATQLSLAAKGVTRYGLSHGAIKDIVLPTPPVDEQTAIAQYINEATTSLDRARDRVEREIDLIREYRTRLIADVVTGKVDVRNAAAAMKTNRKVVAKRAITPELAVAALDAEIVARLNADGGLHRVKRHKATCLAYHHAQLAPINPQFVRDAAGPRDLDLIDAANHEAENQQWFRETVRRGWYYYETLAKLEARKDVLRDLWADRLPRINEVLLFLKGKPRQTCENLATLYMAWNDLLIWRQEPTDDAIVEEVIQLWPGKDAILEATWRSDLRQLRASALQPTGFGVPTRERGLFEGARS